MTNNKRYSLKTSNIENVKNPYRVFDSVYNTEIESFSSKRAASVRVSDLNNFGA